MVLNYAGLYTAYSSICNFEDFIFTTILSNMKIPVTFVLFSATSNGNKSCEMNVDAMLVTTIKNATFVSYEPC